MQLRNVFVEGFRRFESGQNLNLSTKLTAIVGPNEAGKSSLLKAIACLNDDEPIAATDQTSLSETEPLLKLSFFLHHADLEAAALIRPTWLDVIKRSDGKRRYDLRPRPERELSRRHKLKIALERLARSNRIMQRLDDDGLVGHDDINNIISILNKNTEFSEKDCESISEINQIFLDIDGENLSNLIIEIPKIIEDLLQFERSHDPFQNAINVLAKKVPKILTFSPEYRNIDLPYDLNLYANSDPSVTRLPSQALAEIVRLAQLDLGQLKKVILEGNEGVKAGLMAKANEQLAATCRKLWRQSDAALQLSLNGLLLDVLVRHEDGFEIVDQFSKYEARSDGYKQFIALQIFVFLEETEDSIVLIDEVEHHLHYDAQADLIQLLQDETAIGSVVYTTHSAGSLPEDLGQGVRAVQWSAENKKVSNITNKFWFKNDTQGMRPLLFGMGAATFAFFPTRRAIIGEGVSEMLLLPAIFKSALKCDSLDFQVVHGLASFSPSGLPMLDPPLDKVCFFTDSDTSGAKIRAALEKAGIQGSRLFSISELGARLVTIEDIVDSWLWIQSVNRHIEMYGQGKVEPISSAPQFGRLSALPPLIAKEKVSIAYNVLEISRENPDRSIFERPLRPKVEKLAIRLRHSLGLSAQ